MAYVLKLTDYEYSSPVYIGKGSILSHGSYGWFLEDAVFETEDEAKAHIQTCLESGWYRTDITPANFELIEVKLYPDLKTGFYYTEDEYARHIAEDYDEKILAAAKELKDLKKKEN